MFMYREDPGILFFLPPAGRRKYPGVADNVVHKWEGGCIQATASGPNLGSTVTQCPPSRQTNEAVAIVGVRNIRRSWRRNSLGIVQVFRSRTDSHISRLSPLPLVYLSYLVPRDLLHSSVKEQPLLGVFHHPGQALLQVSTRHGTTAKDVPSVGAYRFQLEPLYIVSNQVPALGALGQNAFRISSSSMHPFTSVLLAKTSRLAPDRRWPSASAQPCPLEGFFILRG